MREMTVIPNLYLKGNSKKMEKLAGIIFKLDDLRGMP